MFYLHFWLVVFLPHFHTQTHCSNIFKSLLSSTLSIAKQLKRLTEFFERYMYHTPGKIYVTDHHMFTHALSKFTITIHRYHEVGPVVYFFYDSWLIHSHLLLCWTYPSLSVLCPVSHVKATLCTKKDIKNHNLLPKAPAPKKYQNKSKNMHIQKQYCCTHSLFAV